MLKNFLLSALFVTCLVVCAQAQGSSFTFQGKLNDNNSPANGTYEMQFRLLDSGGSQIGLTTTLNNVSVTNGVFTVRLTFGTLAFDGNPRFLEVGVRPSGSANPFTLLDPPQSVLSAPYAVRSLTAGTADLAINANNATNAVNSTNATTAINSSQLGGIAANQYVLTTDSRLSDDRNPIAGSGNYVQNTTNVQQTSNFNISGTGRANVFSVVSQYNVGNTRLIGINGTSNLFAGVNSGTNTTGTGNAFFGGLSGQNTTTGINNAFFGFNAGSANNGGGANTFIGVNSGLANVGSSNNTFVGANAGNTNLTSNGNTYIGANSDGATLITNSVAIGQKAFAGQSNALILGSINGVNTATADTDVGIGTPNPLARFHVVGDSLLVGNVGIGTTTPTARLQVVDNSSNIAALKVAGSFAGGTGIEIDNTAGGGRKFAIFTNNGSNSCCYLHIVDQISGNEVLAMNGSSTTGSTNGVTVFTKGDFDADGFITAGRFSSSGSTSVCRNGNGTLSVCSSSIRCKKDIQPFFGGLSMLNKLKPVTFSWKSDDMHDVGFIAEEVAEIEPLLTTTDKDGQIEGVKYDRITTVLVNSVKEQQMQIEQQQIQIDRQDAQIQKQQLIIDELRKLLCENNRQADICKEDK